MGFIYCPNCGMSVSDQANIPSCPKCYHPFNAQEWQKIQAKKDANAAEEKRKKDAIAAEEKRKRDEKEQQLNNAQKSNKCPSCGKPISWEKKYRSSDGWNTWSSYTLQRPYCESCGWKPSLAFEECKTQGTSNSITTRIVDWENAIKESLKYKDSYHGY
jgi:hypothetical protein